MKDNKNRLITKLIRIGKRSRYFRYPVLALLFVVMAFRDFALSLGALLKKNAYRVSSAAALILIFLVSSSFAFHGNADGQEAAAVESGIHMTEAGEMLFSEEESGQDQGIRPLEDAAVVSEEDGKLTEASFADDWMIVLVNKSNPIPSGYDFELGTIKGSVKADVRIIEETNVMLRDAKADGIDLVICSPYRDYDRQVMLFDRKVKNYMKQGMSYMDAYMNASQTVAVPGASEHQLGLALDIVCESHYGLDAAFGETEAGKWLAENSYKYGFILRYPQGKENITGIEYEPWHFRYVGQEAARTITQQGLTLEEYVEQIGLK